MRKNNDNGSADAARDRMIKRQSGNRLGEVDAAAARDRMIQRQTDRAEQQKYLDSCLGNKSKLYRDELERLGPKAKFYQKELKK